MDKIIIERVIELVNKQLLLPSQWVRADVR